MIFAIVGLVLGLVLGLQLDITYPAKYALWSSAIHIGR